MLFRSLDQIYEIDGRTLMPIHIFRVLGPWDRQHNPHLLNRPVRFTNMVIRYMGQLKWVDQDSCSGVPNCSPTTYEVSPDLGSLIVRHWRMGTSTYFRML